MTDFCAAPECSLPRRRRHDRFCSKACRQRGRVVGVEEPVAPAPPRPKAYVVALEVEKTLNSAMRMRFRPGQRITNPLIVELCREHGVPLREAAA